MLQTVLLIFSSKGFIEFSLTFRSLIHFEGFFFFFFFYGARKCSNFVLLHITVQLFQHHLLKTVSLLYCIFLPPWLKIRNPWVCGFISGIFILLHWSIFLFLIQYHTFLMTVALQHNPKSGKVDSPGPFFPKIDWLFRIFFVCLFVSIRTVRFFLLLLLFQFCKNTIGTLIGITVNLQIAFGSIFIFTILILLIRNMEYLSICLVCL